MQKLQENAIYFLEDFEDNDDHCVIGGENWLQIVTCGTLKYCGTLMTPQKRETSLALNVMIIVVVVTLRMVIIIIMVRRIVMSVTLILCLVDGGPWGQPQNCLHGWQAWV